VNTVAKKPESPRLMRLTGMRRLLQLLPLWWSFRTSAGGGGGGGTPFSKDDGNGTVAPLTASNFNAHMAEGDKPTLIMFHVDWCGVCRRTYPIFVEACVEASALQLGARCAHVDCGTDKKLCERFEVKGYPTIKLFTPGESLESPIDTRCPRTKVGFLSYLKRMVKEPVQRLPDELWAHHTLEEYLQDEPLATFVAVLPEGAEAPFGAKSAAESWRDRHSFLSVPDLRNALGSESPLLEATASATLVSYSTAQQQWAANNKTAAPALSVFKEDTAVNETTHEWVKNNRFPGIWRLYDGIFSDFVRAGRRIAVVVVNPWHDNTMAEDALWKAHAALKDEFAFGVLDGLEWAEPLTDFNIYVYQLPRVFIMEDGFQEWIEDVEELRVSELASDLKNVLAGAPLLRQGYSFVKRVQFHVRETKRKLIKIWGFAQKGPKQGALVAVATILSLAASATLLSCCGMVFREMFTMDSDVHDKYD